jgi:hypothetical protein
MADLCEADDEASGSIKGRLSISWTERQVVGILASYSEGVGDPGSDLDPEADNLTFFVSFAVSR